MLKRRYECSACHFEGRVANTVMKAMLLMRIPVSATIALTALSFTVPLSGATPRISAHNRPETFTAFAVNVDGGNNKTATVDIQIDCWSPVNFGQCLDERQAEAEARSTTFERRIHLGEHVEYVLELIGAMPMPVAHADDHL